MQHSNLIIDFSKYVSERTQNFTGREWVFQAINDWLADPEAPRFFLITGEPGSGKTAIAARLYQISSNRETAWSANDLPYIKPGFLSAIHFCSARDTYWRDPQTFARSIALQLAQQERYNVFAKALAEKSTDRIYIEVKLENVTAQGQNANITAVHIGSIEIKGAPTEDVYNRLIREPLQALLDEKPNEQVIILVDALDEALVYSGDVNIVSLLADSQNLPKGVRFIITSRKDERIENRFFGSAGLYLSSIQFSEQNQNDISNYVRKRFSNDEKLASKVKDSKQGQLNDLIKKIMLKADGNFQYITFLLNSISSGYQKLEEIDKLPHGLDALYYDSLGRLISPGSNDWLNYSSLLGILSVAQESLTQSQLQNFTGLSEPVVWESLGKLEQFIEEIAEDEANGNIDRIKKQEEPVYRLYHQSFVDFLHGQYIVIEIDNTKKKLRNGYYLLPENWHKKIVEHYRTGNTSWNDVNWDEVDNYGLLYLATHLHALKDTEGHKIRVYRQELYSLICKPFMQQKLTRFGSFDSFSADVMLAIDAARLEDPPNIVQEIRGIVIHVIISSFSDVIPNEVLGTLARIGRDTEALGLAGLKAIKNRAFLFIGQSLIERGELKKGKGIVLDAVDKIVKETTPKYYQEEQPYTMHLLSGTKMDIQSHLVSVMLQIGELTKLLEAIKSMEDAMFCPCIDCHESRADVLSGLVRGLVKAGKFVELQQLTKIIRHSWRANLLYIIVYELASNGNYDQALTIAKKINDEYWKCLSLCSLAESFGQQKQLVKVKGILEIALSAAKSIKDNNNSRVDAMARIAEILIQIGDKKKANEIINNTPFSRKKSVKILIRKAQVLAKAGKKSEVLKLAKNVLEELALDKKGSSIEVNKIRARTLRPLVGSLCEIGELDQAISVAEKMDSIRSEHADESAAIVLSEVIKFLAKVGKLDQTHMLVSLPYEEYYSLTPEVVKRLVVENDFDNALAVIEKIPSPNEYFTLQFLCNALIKGHEWKNVNDITDKIFQIVNSGRKQPPFDQEEKTTVLGQISLLLSMAGECSKAEKIANNVLAACIQNESKGNDISQLLYQIPRIMIEVNKFDKAVIAATAKRKGYGVTDIVYHLCKIAEALAKAGKLAKAIEIADYARTAAMSDKGEFFDLRSVKDVAMVLNPRSLMYAAMAMAWAGKTSQALSLIKFIDDNEVKTETRAHVAWILAEKSEISQSTELANSVLNLLEKQYQDGGEIKLTYPTDTIKALAHAFTLTKDSQAIKRILMIARKDSPSLGDVVDVIAESGDLERAIALADGIDDDMEKEFAWEKLVSHILTQKGDLAWALKACDSINDISCKTRATANAALFSVDEGNKDKTIEIVNQLLKYAESNGLHPQTKFRALESVGQALTQVGEINRALELAEKTKGEYRDEERMHIINGIAYGLANASQYKQAVSLWGGELIKYYSNGIFDHYVRQVIPGIISDAFPFIKCIDNEETIWKIYEELVEVESWWAA